MAKDDINADKNDHICSTDPAKEIHRVVYDDFFPEVTVVFHEVHMERVLLVGGLSLEVMEKQMCIRDRG